MTIFCDSVEGDHLSGCSPGLGGGVRLAVLDGGYDEVKITSC